MKELLELSVEDFESLQASGVLYKLYPNAPYNLPSFVEMKEEYALNEAAFNFFLTLTALSATDVEELIELFQEYKNDIKVMIQNFDRLDIVDLIESVRNELE
jgi:hypothetical protein